jgi:hypothetical protein
MEDFSDQKLLKIFIKIWMSPSKQNFNNLKMLTGIDATALSKKKNFFRN